MHYALHRTSCVISLVRYRSRRSILRRTKPVAVSGLIFDLRHAARADQLSTEEWTAFCGDLYVAQRASVSITKPDNVR